MIGFRRKNQSLAVFCYEYTGSQGSSYHNLTHLLRKSFCTPVMSEYMATSVMSVTAHE